MGAEAIRKLLGRINLKEEAEKIREEIIVTSSETREKKLSKRLEVDRIFLKFWQQSEWMIMTILPVLPPDLRPLVPLDGGKICYF